MKERKREGEFSTSLDRCYPRKGEEEEEEEYPRCPWARLLNLEERILRSPEDIVTIALEQRRVARWGRDAGGRGERLPFIVGRSILSSVRPREESESRCCEQRNSTPLIEAPHRTRSEHEQRRGYNAPSSPSSKFLLESSVWTVASHSFFPHARSKQWVRFCIKEKRRKEAVLIGSISIANEGGRT